MKDSINTSALKLAELATVAAQKNLIRKIVFSKPQDKSILKMVISQKQIGKKNMLQAEYFHKDNKVTHTNIPIDENTSAIILELAEAFSQINLICNGCECQYRSSSPEKHVLIGGPKAERFILGAESKEADTESNNKEKKHILDGSEPFLKLLGVSDANGRIYDKKQSKFRQINRFLEIVRDTEDKLPTDKIRICDLCCGKSYLSFAVYHYFANIKKYQVSMTGVDLKPDVIEYCSETARKLGFDGLEFICGDINEYESEEKPSLVISLHACDIATDMVLCKAAKWKADVILSTPCCHHELNHNISCPTLSFITDYSMLRQKLCDAATDALRLCRLEAEGYSTVAIELIDPEETPKNVMLRAIRKKNFRPDSQSAKEARERYLAAKAFLCGDRDTEKLHF